MKKFMFGLLAIFIISCSMISVQPKNTVKGKFVGIVYELTDFKFLNRKAHKKAVKIAALQCAPNVPKVVYMKVIHRPLAWKMDGQVAFFSSIPYMFIQFNCVAR